VDYARGVTPETAGWGGDARARCLELLLEAKEKNEGDNAPATVDRRLWTWEARFNVGPPQHQLRFIVLSPGQASSLTPDELRDIGDLPASIKVITDRPSAAGIEELFSSVAVATALVTATA
jgi:hypothetical protein